MNIAEKVFKVLATEFNVTETFAGGRGRPVNVDHLVETRTISSIRDETGGTVTVVDLYARH